MIPYNLINILDIIHNYNESIKQNKSLIPCFTPDEKLEILTQINLKNQIHPFWVWLLVMVSHMCSYLSYNS